MKEAEAMKAYEAVARVLLDNGVSAFRPDGDQTTRYLASYLDFAEGRYAGASSQRGFGLDIRELGPLVEGHQLARTG